MALYDRILSLLEGDEEKANEAYTSIQAGRKASWHSLFFNLTAPIVVPIALLWCNWESEKLPNWARKWDNNVSLNGDNGDWLDLDGDGIPDTSRMSYEDTPEIRAKCYWGMFGLAGKIHPRSYLARFFWIGLRNRGKQADVDAGIVLDMENSKLVRYGIAGIRGIENGECLHYRDGHWHYSKLTQFLKYFTKVEQRGWKVANANILHPTALPVSYISFKNWG